MFCNVKRFVCEGKVLIDGSVGPTKGAGEKEDLRMPGRLFGLTAAALLALSVGARAQESASSGITGQVLDSSTASVPGATVTVMNIGTNAQRVTQSDAEGRFSVPNLPPAIYSLKVE